MAKKRYVGSLINHSNTNDNCWSIKVTRNRKRNILEPYIMIVATKEVRNGEQLLLNYGNNYQLNREGESHTTKYKRTR